MRWFLILLICGQAASCGQKGPLRLPDGAALAAPSAPGQHVLCALSRPALSPLTGACGPGRH